MSIHYRSSFPASKVGNISPLKLQYQHRQGLYRDAAKRAFDVLCVAILAVPTVLILLLVMPFIMRKGGAPFYRQERVGQNGATFNLWKLRSMVPNADEKLAAYLADNPQARIEWDHHQKLKNDPRITPIGRFIRKTSIDELPQLLNVLRGEMSMVGPRPMMTSQQDIYPGQAYYEMRPGITGAWQVSDRHETSFAERALFDTKYYNQVSLMTDIGIMLRTITVVAKAGGA